jgi:hypothetical protein
MPITFNIENYAVAFLSARLWVQIPEGIHDSATPPKKLATERR